MCGLAGILRVYPPGASVPSAAASIPQAWIDTLDEHIKHRGPDGFGVFRDRAVRSDGATVDVALLHRRLAIIDPACGQQPMVSADGHVAVVFNGCIYNHAELRRELEQQGCVFQTDHSDTEVLVQGWQAWGNLLFEKLDGMYATLIWDRQRAHLMRARDRMGEKPLYASIHTPHVQWFASSAAACIALHEVVRTDMQNRADAQPHDMAAWLARGAALACVGQRVVEHPPGWQESPLSIDPQLDPVSLFPHAAPAQAAEPLTRERLESLLRQSVIARMVSDVPLGCFLSGGVDSSLIAALAQEHLRARGQRLQTFTMQMPHAAYDESPYAQAVGEHLQTEHHVLSCERDVASDLIMLIEQLGLPFGDSSLLPTYWLCKAARQQVKVALAGDGGDELFAGYDRHWAGLFLSKYGRVLRSLPSAELLASDDPKRGRNKLARLVDAAKHAGYQDLVAIFPASMYAKLTSTPIDEHMMKHARAA
ncbi:MAG TPA: asparagine synthase (glutamine-hydrolyzing), partial [Phycisphaerales bacterium]|nr:asparagine synthase (glutamine-hydrolyzing) [Phycisphaerales bacterium]